MSTPRFHARTRSQAGSRKLSHHRRGLGSTGQNTVTSKRTQGARPGNLGAGARQTRTDHVRMGCPQVPWSWLSECPSTKIKKAQWGLLTKILNVKPAVLFKIESTQFSKEALYYFFNDWSGCIQCFLLAIKMQLHSTNSVPFTQFFGHSDMREFRIWHD